VPFLGASFTAVTMAISVILMPLLDFLMKGKGERHELALGFKENLDSVFIEAGLGAIDIGEVGGQGRDPDPLLPLTGELAQFAPALGLLEATVAGVGDNTFRRGGLLSSLMQNALVRQNATAGQARQIFKSIMGDTPDRAMLMAAAAVTKPGFGNSFIGNSPGGQNSFRFTDEMPDVIDKMVERYIENLRGIEIIYETTIPDSHTTLATLKRGGIDSKLAAEARSRIMQHGADNRTFLEIKSVLDKHDSKSAMREIVADVLGLTNYDEDTAKN